MIPIYKISVDVPDVTITITGIALSCSRNFDFDAHEFTDRSVVFTTHPPPVSPTDTIDLYPIFE